MKEFSDFNICKRLGLFGNFYLSRKGQDERIRRIKKGILSLLLTTSCHSVSFQATTRKFYHEDIFLSVKPPLIPFPRKILKQCEINFFLT